MEFHELLQRQAEIREEIVRRLLAEYGFRGIGEAQEKGYRIVFERSQIAGHEWAVICKDLSREEIPQLRYEAHAQ